MNYLIGTNHKSKFIYVFGDDINFLVELAKYSGYVAVFTHSGVYANISKDFKAAGLLEKLVLVTGTIDDPFKFISDLDEQTFLDVIDCGWFDLSD